MTSTDAPSINGNENGETVDVVVRTSDNLSSLPDSPAVRDSAASPDSTQEEEESKGKVEERIEKKQTNDEERVSSLPSAPSEDGDVDGKSAKTESKSKKDAKKPAFPSTDEIPLISLLNRKSGGGKGLRAFEELENLPHSHVMDILEFAKKDTAEADAKLRDLIDANPHCRLIVGGGDGTVTWTFEILHRIGRSPPVATLPLGTANELSGCIGWSNGDNGKRLHKFAHKVRRGEITDLDLWKVEYLDDDEKEQFEGRRPGTMVAFLSFGLDATIAHKFHNHRERMTSRPATIHAKAIYLRYGVDEIRHPSPKLNDTIEITVDGGDLKKKPERSYRCLQVLNINSMADGVDFFGTSKSNKDDVLKEGDYDPPKLNDGKLEVIGTTTVHSMNFMRVGIGHSLRLAQGKSFEFTLKQDTPMEVDGEAWINPKGVVRVTHWGAPEIVIGPKHNSSTRRGILHKHPSSGLNSKTSL